MVWLYWPEWLGLGFFIRLREGVKRMAQLPGKPRLAKLRAITQEIGFDPTVVVTTNSDGYLVLVLPLPESATKHLLETVVKR